MLRVSALSKSYSGETVLRDVSFVLPPGQRAGLVGPNGAGKSTLLGIIAGLVDPDGGSVWTDPADRVAYLPQYPADQLSLTVRSALFAGAGHVGELHVRIAELEGTMQTASRRDLEGALQAYAEARDEYDRLQGYDLESRIERVVDGLSLDAAGLDTLVAALSGGNKTKLSLARLLLSDATIVLLDEPTNYLDLPAVLWLEDWVRESDRSFIVVSHDRRFLDRTIGTVLEMDGESRTIRTWSGTYSDYTRAKKVEQDAHLAAYLDQQEEIARVEEDIRRTKEQARSTQAQTKSGLGADHARRLSKKVARKAKVRERRLERELDENTIEKPRKGWGLHLVDLGRDPIDDGRIVLTAEHLKAGYDGREILRGLDLSIRGRDRVALVGANGSGKSTLVRCVTGAIPFAGTLTLGPSIQLGVLSQEHENLELDSTVLDTFRSRTEMHESDARTYLHRFLFSGREVLKQVRTLSYGQRSKLALAILILSRSNFLVLDEPTSHLDMPAVEAMESTLAGYRGPLLLISHDRAFIDTLGVTRVEVMEEGRLRAVESMVAYENEIRQHERLRA